MSDYISREAAKRAMLDFADFYSCEIHNAEECVIEYMNALPAADVVEVVRCKHCKHWNRNMMNGRYPDNVMCKCCEYTHSQFTGYTAPDDYCSFAERVEEND